MFSDFLDAFFSHQDMSWDFLIILKANRAVPVYVSQTGLFFTSRDQYLMSSCALISFERRNQCTSLSKRVQHVHIGGSVYSPKKTQENSRRPKNTSKNLV